MGIRSVMNKALLINPHDNVAVALGDIGQGSAITVLGAGTVACVKARERIPFLHKVAMQHLSKGQSILKYGLPIGVATAEIKAGDWVHTHNVRSSFASKRADSQ